MELKTLEDKRGINLQRKYNILHHAKEYSFDYFLKTVDYKEAILLSDIDKVCNLHSEEENLRVYFNVLGLIETLKSRVKEVDECDRVVYGWLDEFKFKNMFESGLYEPRFLSANTKIGDIFLAIFIHLRKLKSGLIGYELHPYVEFFMSELFDELSCFINDCLTVRGEPAFLLDNHDRENLINNSILKARVAINKVDNCFLIFIDVLNSGKLKDKKDAFERKSNRNAKKFAEFINSVNFLPDKHIFVFRLSFACGVNFGSVISNCESSLFVDVFNKSISDFGRRFSRNDKCVNFIKIFHIIKFSKMYGLHTDSYFVYSFDKDGIPFSSEQIERWSKVDKELLIKLKDLTNEDRKKTGSIHPNGVTSQEISRYLNSVTEKGKRLDKILKKFDDSYVKEIDKETPEVVYASLTELSELAKKGKMHLNRLQINYELCALIDDIKSSWNKIFLKNLKRNHLLESEFVKYKDSERFFVKDIFELIGNSSKSMTKILSPVLRDEKNKFKYNAMIGLLHMKPLYGDLDVSRNAYLNGIKCNYVSHDLFVADIDQVTASLHFLKLNVNSDGKQLDEIRIVNRK